MLTRIERRYLIFLHDIGPRQCERPSKKKLSDMEAMGLIRLIRKSKYGHHDYAITPTGKLLLKIDVHA